MSKVEEAYNKKQRIMKWVAGGIFIGGSIFVIFAPYLLTRRDWGFTSFDQETGFIGDTIGGITAPIVNLISAILVYFAFRAQVDANTLVHQQISDEKLEREINQNRNFVFERYKQLKEEFSSFTVQDINILGERRGKLKGYAALQKVFFSMLYVSGRFSVAPYELKQFNKMIELIEDFPLLVQETTLKQSDRDFFLDDIEYLYLSKIKTSIEQVISESSKIGTPDEINEGNLFILMNRIERFIINARNLNVK